MNIMKRRNGALLYDDGVDALIDRSIARASTQATTIRANAFKGCTQLKSVNAPNVTSIGKNAFDSCSAFEKIILPTNANIGDYAFAYSGITSINVSHGYLGGYAFNRCTRLETAVFGSAYLHGWGANYYGNWPTFGGCTSLKTIDITGLDSSSNANHQYRVPVLCHASLGDTTVDTIILRREDVLAAIYNVDALANEYFQEGGTGGTIYIPRTLYNELGTGSSLDYRSADIWSTVDGYGTITWAKIEGSQYENYYADGTPIE